VGRKYKLERLPDTPPEAKVVEHDREIPIVILTFYVVATTVVWLMDKHGSMFRRMAGAPDKQFVIFQSDWHRFLSLMTTLHY